jgi:hypothetical protein
MAEINTEGLAVFQHSWLAGRYQWQAHTPEKIMQGTADTEEEAWEKARAAARTLRAVPKGSG